jgi:hypothetical protein
MWWGLGFSRQPNIFLFLFSLPPRLSHDSNILRTFVTDGKGLHGVEFVLVSETDLASGFG